MGAAIKKFSASDRVEVVLRAHAAGAFENWRSDAPQVLDSAIDEVEGLVGPVDLPEELALLAWASLCGYVPERAGVDLRGGTLDALRARAWIRLNLRKGRP